MTKMLHYLRDLTFTNFAVEQKADFQTKHAYAMNSGSALPFCNRVCATSDVTAQEVADIIQFFGSMPFRWFVHEQDSAQINVLEQSGLRFVCSFPAMAVHLADINPQAYNAGITVKEMSSNADIEQWISIVTQAYGMPDESAFAGFIQNFRLRADSGDIACYCGFYEGKAVAASQIIRHRDAAALHWVGTLPAYRHKGAGLAVSLQPLLDMHAAGYETAILFASPAGRPLYEKLGFKEYAKYKVYGI